MTMEALQSTEACVFDAYGTLFDVHSAVAACKADIGPEADRLSKIWRQKQLEYSWLRSLMGIHADFEQVTADALDYAMALLGIEDKDMRTRLLSLYMTLSCYPEVPAALKRLRSMGLRTAILSNGSPRMLDAAVQSAGLADLLEMSLSVEDVGIYKPDPRVYQIAVDRLKLAPSSICFLSSNAWDIAGSSSFGFRAIWVNRSGAPRENLPGGPITEIPSLSLLPELLTKIA